MQSLPLAPVSKSRKLLTCPDELLGDMVVSCIVAHEGSELTANGVREFARQTLASYKVPRQVLFFDESEIELTGSAKIKTAELRELAAKRLLKNND